MVVCNSMSRAACTHLKQVINIQRKKTFQLLRNSINQQMIQVPTLKSKKFRKGNSLKFLKYKQKKHLLDQVGDTKAMQCLIISNHAHFNIDTCK